MHKLFVSKKHMPEATKPEDLSPEVIREIEEKILCVNTLKLSNNPLHAISAWLLN